MLLGVGMLKLISTLKGLNYNVYNIQIEKNY
jgi:hypothetical protein